MATSIRFELETTSPEHRIKARTFLDAMGAACDLLHELDKTIGRGRFEWYFTELRVGSGIAEIQADWVEQGEDVPPDFEIEELEERIAHRCIEGLSLLDTAPEWPEDFSPDALDASRRLVEATRDEVVSIAASASSGGKTELTERVIANVKELVGEKYTAFGSVEGVIESISLARAHRQFRIRDEVTGRSIVGNFERSEAEAVRSAWGKRTLVRGLLAYSKHGIVTAIRSTTDIIPLPSSEIESVDHLVGIAPDFTDGLPSDVFINRLHDEQ